MDLNEIAPAVRAIVAESLALEADRVALESRLIADLGADSIDLIDMIFAIERRFAVKVRDGEFAFLTRLDFSSQKVVKDGAITREVMEQLKEWLPALREVPEGARISPRDLFSMITVETLCLMVERKTRACAATAREPAST